MQKLAENDYPIHELIKARWSPRSFSDERVDDEVLLSLFEAARWAPSSYNDQPWTFIVAREHEDEETYQGIHDCLFEGNQSWARTAPVLGVSVARKRFEFNGEPNRHALHDAGLAMENLVLQAMDHGLYVHQMAGFDVEKVIETFDVPEHHEPVAGFALGYPGEPDQLPEELQEEEKSGRSRKELEEFVFTGEWGTPSEFNP